MDNSLKSKDLKYKKVHIRHDNMLKKPLTDYKQKDKVDVILANPPFGGQEEIGIEKGFPSRFQTRKTADLFLVLIMRLLKIAPNSQKWKRRSAIIVRN